MITSEVTSAFTNPIMYGKVKCFNHEKVKSFPKVKKDVEDASVMWTLEACFERLVHSYFERSSFQLS